MTIYNTIERRMYDEGSSKDNLRTGRPPVLDTYQRKYWKDWSITGYTEKQAKKSQELYLKLTNWFYRDSCSVIMNDEKYLIFFGQNMPQNACYYTDNKESCPDNVRFHGIEKYPNKILAHVTISDRGISQALIRPSGS